MSILHQSDSNESRDNRPINESAITVENQNGVLVVDSRLVALDLGIEHESFMRTIKKHETRIEQRFGIIRFEIGEIKGRGQPEKFAWLTEDQSLYLMTLSRNTEQVLNCKANLVEGFMKAKQIIPQLQQDNETLRLLLDLERERNKGKELDNTMLTLHGDRVVLALRGKEDVIVEKETVVTEIVEPEKGRSTKILSADQLKKAVRDRTGQKLPSLKYFVDALRKAGRDDLIEAVPRAVVGEYPLADKLDEAIKVVYGNRRQQLIGE